jgi:hypothetical protein
MIRFRALTALAVCIVLAAAFAACSDDDDSDPPGDTAIDDAFAEAAQAAANASVLTQEDMTPEWRAEPDEVREPADGSGLSGDCEAFEQDQTGWPAQAAHAASPAFIGPTHEVNSSASVFERAADADSLLTSYFDLFEECRQQLIDAAMEDPAFTDTDTYNISAIEGLDFGDLAGGIRVELTAVGEPFVVDFIHVQQGRIITTLIYGGGTAADADRDTYVAKQVEKASLAEEALPD